MAWNAGFADDFEEFRRQGEIGLVVALHLDPPSPEIGSHCRTTMTGMVQGVLRASDGRSWDMAEDAPVEIQVLAPTHLWLLDERGQVAAQANLAPWIERPLLTTWELPAQVDWTVANWNLPRPRTQGTARVAMSWQFEGAADWVPLEPGHPLPLPNARARMKVRAVLQSRHARFSPEATLVVEREVEVVPPQPTLLQPFNAPMLSCHEAHGIAADVAFAKRLSLVLGGETVAEVVGDGQATLELRHAVRFEECGSHELQILAHDLEEEIRVLFAGKLTIQARPVSVRFAPVEGQLDAFEVRVDGGKHQSVLVPLTDERWDDLPGAFELLLQSTQGAQVTLEVVDDAGACHQYHLALQPRPLQWLALPSFEPLPHPAW